MRLRRAGLLTLVILLAGAAVAGAATVTLTTGLLASSDRLLTHTSCTLSASGDTYVNEASTTTNYSFATTLNTASVSGGRQRAFLQFNLGSCANIANAFVDSATLALNVTSASGSTRTLKVYRVTASWTASTATWAAQPAYAASTNTTFTASASTTGPKSIDVSNDVNEYVATSPTVLPPYSSATVNYGWAIVDEGGSNGVVSYSSSESTTVANRPKLTVAYSY